MVYKFNSFYQVVTNLQKNIDLLDHYSGNAFLIRHNNTRNLYWTHRESNSNPPNAIRI